MTQSGATVKQDLLDPIGDRVEMELRNTVDSICDPLDALHQDRQIAPPLVIPKSGAVPTRRRLKQLGAMGVRIFQDRSPCGSHATSADFPHPVPMELYTKRWTVFRRQVSWKADSCWQALPAQFRR